MTASEGSSGVGSGGGGEHYCLKWNNYQTNIVQALGTLKLDEDFVDVTVSCQGRSIKAHKVVLSACSDYFKDVFKENPCQHPVVILQDASFEDVEGLVRYIYRGEVDVRHERLQSFLRTADLLKIKGLAEQRASAEDQHQQQQGRREPPATEKEGTNQPDYGGLLNSLLPSAMMGPLLQQQQQQQHQGTPTSVPSEMPIKVPVPPSSSLPAAASTSASPPAKLIKGGFGSLAQFLSGVGSGGQGQRNDALTPPPIVVTTERRMVPQRTGGKRQSPTVERELHFSPHRPNYSGSTSSLSPSSPPTTSEECGDGQERRSAGLKSPMEEAARAVDEEDERPLVIQEEDDEGEEEEQRQGCPAASTTLLKVPTSTSKPVSAPQPPMAKIAKASSTSGFSISDLVHINNNSSSSDGDGRPFQPITPAPTLTFAQLPLESIATSSVQASTRAAPIPAFSACSAASLSHNGMDQSVLQQQQHLPLGMLAAAAVKVANAAAATSAQRQSNNSGINQDHNNAKKSAVSGKVSKSKSATPNNNIVNNNNKASSGSSPNSVKTVSTNADHPRHRWRCMQPQECPYCFKKFSNSFNLKQHIINVHSQSPGVPCDVCNKVVKNKWYLRKHQVTAHGAPLKRKKDAGAASGNAGAAAAAAAAPGSSDINNDDEEEIVVDGVDSDEGVATPSKRSK